MADIIMQVPWNCGEKDCTVGWHLGSYWIQDEGAPYTYDSFTDGDHEDLDSEDDLPSDQEIRKAWEAYDQDCLATGTDPLYQYNVQHTLKRESWWTVELTNSIVGVRFLQARRGTHSRGLWINDAAMLPEEVRNYMLLELHCGNWYMCINEPGKRSTMPEVRELIGSGSEDTKILQGTGTLKLRLRVKIKEIVPRSEAAVAKDIRKIARRKRG